jgi:hypothetical protein
MANYFALEALKIIRGGDSMPGRMRRVPHPWVFGGWGL